MGVFVTRHPPLSIEISAESSKKLNQAVKMAEDLVGAIWEEYTAEFGKPKRSKGSSKGKEGRDRDAGGKGKGKFEFSKNIKLKHCDPAFRLRSVIIGEGGANVKHIQEQGKSKVSVKEEHGEMRIEIGADSQDALRKTDTMLRDLISVAYKQYDEWKSDRGTDVRKERDSRDKGKGKRRERIDDSDRPSKRIRN